MSPSVEAVCVDPRRVEGIWHIAKPMIDDAMKKTGLNTIEEVERDVLSGRSLLWLAWDGKIRAAAVTEIAKDVCTIVACAGGGMKSWLHLIKRLESYARDEGCGMVRILGRKGWVRVLKNYQAKHVILERRL